MKHTTSEELVGTPEVFGKKLLNLRMQLKLTQQDMANRLGVSTTAYVYWEKGRRLPYINRIKSVADALGVPIAYFSNEVKLTETLKLNDELFTAADTIPLLEPNDFEKKTSHHELYKKITRYNPEKLQIKDPKNYFAFRVRTTDMMTNTRMSIPNGSIAICTTRFSLATIRGTPCVLTVKQGAAIIREVDISGEDQLILRPWNNKYEEEKVKQQDVQIFGKVVSSVITYTDL